MCEEKANEILEEVYRHREEVAREFNYDVHAIFEYLKAKAEEHPERMANLPIAHLEPDEPRAA